MRKQSEGSQEQIETTTSLTLLRNPEGTNLIHWPKPMVMALYDFKSIKSKKTWAAYEIGLKSFFSFLASLGQKTPDDVTTTHLTSYIEYLKRMGFSDRSIRLYCSASSSFFNFLTRSRDTKGTSLIKSNPWRSISDALPKITPYEKKHNKREFTPDEYQKLLATCDRSEVLGKRDYAILTTTLFTTRRREEIVRLRLSDFSEEDGKTHIRFIQKGGAPIRMDLTPENLSAIQDYWTASGRILKPDSPAWVATTDAGKHLVKARNLRMKVGEQPLAASSLDQMIKKRAEQAGLDGEVVNIHMHGLRHLGARMLQARGVNIKEIKERLGHASIKTTDIYLGSMERISSEGLGDFAQVVMGAQNQA